MSNSLYKRLGIGLVSLALPLMLAAPVAAQPHPEEVGHVALECIVGLGIDIHPCAHAVSEGVIDVHEDIVNADLAAQGIGYVVDVGDPVGDEPGELGYDIQDIAVNPLPPSVTDGNPPVPGIVYP
jgi:hypothetical protein